jgi:hypothetical protein
MPAAAPVRPRCRCLSDVQAADAVSAYSCPVRPSTGQNETPPPYHVLVEPLTALSAQFDPLRPLEAAETDLYVDWQAKLDFADDVKVRLANSIARSPGPVTRLFTGHRGAGKTTELNRVRQRLQDGIDSRKVFVSMLFAEQWVHLDDVQPEDLVFQIVRQLVADLDQAGFPWAGTKFSNSLRSIREFLRGRFIMEGAEISVDPLKVSLRFEAFPSRRREFRELLQGLLPTIYDLTNAEILKKAREWLAEPENGGYADIAIIVDSWTESLVSNSMATPTTRTCSSITMGRCAPLTVTFYIQFLSNSPTAARTPGFKTRTGVLS